MIFRCAKKNFRLNWIKVLKLNTENPPNYLHDPVEKYSQINCQRRVLNINFRCETKHKIFLPAAKTQDNECLN